MDDLTKMYSRRLAPDMDFRVKMYKVLCKNVFQKYIKETDTVLDLAAGFCEFINNINAKKKIAVDLNPDIKKYANSDVEIILTPSVDLSKIPSNSINISFTSNFFEHITREEIRNTLKEINRVLKPGGKFLILQPNVRYCYKDYWMFFDHITAIDDRALTEALELAEFKITLCEPRFLPYTTKSILPKSIFLLKLYLLLPFVKNIVGQQAFIIAEKI